MNTILKRDFLKPLAVSSALVFGAIGATELQSSQSIPADDSSRSYMLTVNDPFAVAELVDAIGGTVDHSSNATGVISVSLTSQQLDILSRSSAVSEIDENKAGGLQVGSLPSPELQVAGNPYRGMY